MTEPKQPEAPVNILTPGDRSALDSLGAQDYRTFINSLPEIIWIADAAGHAVFYNNYWYDYTGNAVGTDVRAMAHNAVSPDDYDRLHEHWRDVLSTHKEAISFEFRLRGSDGAYRWFLARGIAQQDAGKIVRWIGSATDIEDMKQAQVRQNASELQARQTADSLRESEERYRALVDASSQIVWTNNAEGQMAGLQPGWASLTGQTEEEYSGYGWAKAVHPDDAQPTIDAWNESVRTRTPFLFEHRVRRKDGTWGLFALRAVPILEDDGTIREWVGIHTDITNNRETERERDALLQNVAEATEKQRRFLRDMLTSMSEGRLRLCDSVADLPQPLTAEPVAPLVTLDRRTIRDLRQQAVAGCVAAGLPPERETDFITAVGEAAMNAVVHAGGGTGTVYPDRTLGVAQVWIVDNGTGINEESLHRATLEKGYTTAGTLGHGFWMMLKTADRVYLLTGASGTTVVLEQEKEPPLPVWMQSFVDAAS